MVHTLKDNYARNISILKENMRRGLPTDQAIHIINGWREQFIKHNLYGEEEREFINQALALTTPDTHITIMEM